MLLVLALSTRETHVDPYGCDHANKPSTLSSLMLTLHTMSHYVAYIYIYMLLLRLYIMCTGCASKNLKLYINTHQTKAKTGKWSSLLLLQQQLHHDQNKINK